MKAMSFLYATDLHGNHSKYKQLLKTSEPGERKRRVAAIILGGDLLPKNPATFARQKNFIQDFLENWAVKILRNNISLYWMLGNDDLRSVEPFFLLTGNRILDRAKVATKREDAGQPIGGLKHIANKLCNLHGTDYEIVGFPYVTDYPFGLKDWCLYDYDGWKPEPYISPPVFSDYGAPNGFVLIDDPETYFFAQGTMRKNLERLPQPRDWRHTIFVCHEPPAHMGLDATARGKCVGSKSVKQFIEFHRPRLSLHGHIHESPEVSEKWYFSSAEWRDPYEHILCIQPGDKHYVWTDINDDGRIEAKRIEYK